MSSFISVVAGYLGMAVVVMIGTAIAAAALIPGGLAGAKTMNGEPPRNYLYSNLALSFVAALFGGWLCARLAPGNPLAHSAALAVLLLVMSIVSARGQATRQPAWYPWTIATLGVVGVLAGAFWEIASAT